MAENTHPIPAPDPCHVPTAHWLDQCLRGAAICLLLTLAAGSAAQAACREVSDLGSARTEHLGKLNAIRKRQEVGTLAPSRLLDKVAQDYACLLADTGHFDHVGPDGSTLSERVERAGYRFCIVAENLARGQRTVAEALMGWITSDGHWRNLRRKGITEVGFGAAFAAPDVADVPKAAGLSLLASELTGTPPPPMGRAAAPTAPVVWVQVFAKPC
jgi:hypothetical protein